MCLTFCPVFCCRSKLQFPSSKVEPIGYSLAVRQNKDKVKIFTSCNYLQKDSIFLEVTCRGSAYYYVAATLKKGEFYYEFRKQTLPEGIISIKLLNKQKQPVAERLIFNERQENRLNLQVNTDKTTYNQREKTVVKIDLEENNIPNETHLSILAINKNQMGRLQNERPNILSYLLLDSDLKGEIETPDYYFNEENINRLKDLDVLLLTQGWSKYQYAKPIDSVFVRPETNLSISGTVSHPVLTEKKEGIKLLHSCPRRLKLTS